MAAMSRGKKEKVFRISKSKKKETPSSRRHRFETFSDRIAKLKIDPIRRDRRPLDDDDVSAHASYFKNSFDEWRDLNLSEDFTNFSREMHPLCESLPQVLYNEDRIMDLLIVYIEKENSLSLEPLLSLIAQLAHDLGSRFEKHFARTVKVVTRVAATHSDFQVIEWSFTCLAWLFKYLSKLLATDLRPLYDLMVSLLGAEQQKAFVVRFAAESLSFLVRKAGTAYHRDNQPLERIIHHIFDKLDLTEAREQEQQLYKDGVSTLLFESTRGIDRGLHSTAEVIFGQALDCAYSPTLEESPANRIASGSDVIESVLIALIHHTDSSTFEPLLNVICDRVKQESDFLNASNIGNLARLLFVAVGVRQGTRIVKWDGIIKSITDIFYWMESHNDISADSRRHVLQSIAIVFQTAPLGPILPHRSVLESLSTASWQPYFLQFCRLFAELGAERFKTLLLPHFERYVTINWKSDGDQLCLLLPVVAKLLQLSSLPLKIPIAWQKSMIASFDQLSILTKSGNMPDDALIAQCNQMIALCEVIEPDADLLLKTTTSLASFFRTALENDQNASLQPWRALAIGSVFKFIVSVNPGCLSSSWVFLCENASKYSQIPLFWETLFRYIKRNGRVLDLKTNSVDLLVSALIESLRSPSHDVRTHCLDILGEMSKQLHGRIPEILSMAIKIESMPLTLDTARIISMDLRNLAIEYKSMSDSKWLARAVPSFLFGMLYVKLAQAWEDSCEALKEISNTKEGSEAVLEVALDWLQGFNIPDSSPEEGPASKPEQENTGPVGDFQCTNLRRLDQRSQQSQVSLENIPAQLTNNFRSIHNPVPARTDMSRSQALRVLNVVPQLAEKKSRLIVPVFLQWAATEEDNVELENELDEENHSSPIAPPLRSQRWNRKDQKSMISLFAHFNNPRVLYKGQEVYSALLSLLANGDVEIQTAALKAVFAWKDPSIKRYEENLLNTLDDARFREQISIFLDVGQDESNVQEDDRSALMPVLLRLLYGKVITRKGAASGRRGQQTKRKAVFIALTRFGEDDIKHFLTIALGPLEKLNLIQDGSVQEEIFAKELSSVRKQHGLLNLLEDFIDTLKADLRPFAMELIDPILYAVVRAVRSLSDGIIDEQPTEQQHSLLRNIRQLGYHCLNTLLTNCPELDWSQYMTIVFNELLQPRLDKLPIETAHSISGVLRLVSVLASSPHTANLLVEYNDAVFRAVANCLDIESAKDEVKLFILKEILLKLISSATDEEAITETVIKLKQQEIREKMLKPDAELFLSRIGNVLERSPSKEILEAGVRSVVRLAPFVGGFSGSKTLITVSIFLLEQPSKRVSATVKNDLLQILHRFLPRSDLQHDQHLFDSVLKVVSSSFAFVQDRNSRSVLCQILHDLALQNSVLIEIAELCDSLNSFSTSRLDEPDFERRTNAFATINEEKFSSFSGEQWLPLVQNMLFFIKDNEELGIRVSASYALRRFVEVSSEDASTDRERCVHMLGSSLIPAIYKGILNPSELVRLEFLSVMAYVVKRFPLWPKVSDMHALLMGNDEEASFFTNILHIQQHRRLRALRRLASEAPSISSDNISRFLIPLIEHYVFDMGEDEQAHNLAAEAIKTISALCKSLGWSQYRALLRRYSEQMLKRAEGMEKTMVKLLVGTVDALSNPTSSSAPNGTSKLSNGEDPSLSVHLTASMDEIASAQCTLETTLPNKEKLTSDLNSHLIPSLMQYIHQKDESTVSLRVPVAEVIVRLLRMLPKDVFEAKLPAVLMDISHILRSRAPESRDMTRKTLSEIMALIGPSYFGFVLKELRTALQRGYQLHVLSYTVHSLILSMSPNMGLGGLDYALDDITTVVMDDIFGITGQEKDAEEYTSKMKEVKSSKSYDTMELVAKIANLRSLSSLISPIRALLQEKLTVKLVKKIDELLRRIGLGVLHNPAADSTDILIFCHEIVREVYKYTQVSALNIKQEDYKTRRYLINMKGADKTASRGTTTSYIHKLTRFAFDILRAVLKKHDNLQTSANLSGWMGAIGDAIVEGQEEVQTAAMRLISTIIRVPLREIDRDAPVYIDQAVRIIEGASSTNSEQAQAALKMVSAVLRERKSIEVKEKHVTKLLQRLRPDLEEPERQGVTFNFLKALMSRKIMVTELYEVIDTIAKMMVTNQTRTARDLARGVYVQFLIEYPQAKKRFKQQRDFLISNLTYKYVEGRQSVMEAINLLLTKINEELTQEISTVVFLPLMQVMVGDENAECREMAAALVKKLFHFADMNTTKTFLSILQSYLEQDQNEGIQQTALQCWRLFFECQGVDETNATFVLGKVQEILDQATKEKDTERWPIAFDALKLYTKVCQVSPEIALAADKSSIWSSVIECHYFPHMWIKHAAAALFEICLTDLAKTNATTGLASLPLRGSGGLKLNTEDMKKLLRAQLRILRIPNVVESLCTQVVKNLLFLGRCFAANRLEWQNMKTGGQKEWNGVERESDDDDDDDDEDDIEVVEAVTNAARTALQHLIFQAASILRREPATSRAVSLYPKTAALQLLAALCSKIPNEELVPSLPTVLHPLFILTSPTTTVPYSSDPDFVTAYAELKNSAQDLMNILQKNLGTTEYVKQLEVVRRGIVERREGRRTKRRIEAVAHPDRTLQRKKTKREGEKVKRKERNMEMRARRRGH